MKKPLYLLLFILLSFAITSCLFSGSSQLQATNEALSNQVNTLMTQLTQQPSSPSTITQIPLSTSGAPSTAGSVAGAAALIFSGSDLETDFQNNKFFESKEYGSANVHMICDPTSTNGGGMWIDAQLQIAYCKANGEAWTPWGQDITIGKHTIYQINAKDKYEIWTVGTPPFTLRNKNSNSTYVFDIGDSGDYVLTTNLMSGQFEVDINCVGGQGEAYKISEPTTNTLRLKPDRCKLSITDITPVAAGPGDIEVSLAPAQ